MQVKGGKCMIINDNGREYDTEKIEEYSSYTQGLIKRLIYVRYVGIRDLWIWVNTSDTICENFFEIPAGEYLIVSTSGQTKTVWPLIEAMKLKPCGNLAKKM